MTMKRNLLLVAALSVIVASSIASANATTYNLANDWGTANPNGPWSFLQGTNLLPYQSSNVCCGINSPGYAPSINPGNFLPVFWQSAGLGSDIFIHSVDGGNGNPALGEATLTWTAPVAGTIDVSGYLYYAQLGLQRGNSYVLSLGGSSLQSGTLTYLNASGPANEVPVSFNGLAVSSGENLSLVLQSLGIGDGGGTMTGLNLIVTETAAAPGPVPGAGLAGLAAFLLLAGAAKLRGLSG